MVRIASPHGQIELPVIVTKDIVAGVLAVPHGWSHKGTGGWRLANGGGGANVNRLCPARRKTWRSWPGWRG